MNNADYIRISNSLKYIALYWNLGFSEITHDYFEKTYRNNFVVKIYADRQTIDFDNKINILNGEFKLNDHKSFVILELVNRLLELGYRPEDINITLNSKFDVMVNNIYIKCFVWDNLSFDKLGEQNNILFVGYQSRLISGTIEFEYFVDYNKNRYNSGLFNSIDNHYNLTIKQQIKCTNKDFIIEGTTLKKYLGNKKIVEIPDGVINLGPGVFWDNQFIEEVVIPDSLENLGGDTFYNCFNLQRFVIKEGVKTMGDNPFGGCPRLNLINKSPYFIYEDGVLYNKDKTSIIYYNIKNFQDELVIPNGVRIIGKHAFYMSNLKKITLPKSIIRLANNPFTNSKYLHLISHCDRYKVIDDVIYTGDMSTVVGALNSIDTDQLVLEDVEVISRNAFFNCKGIRSIILPKTLKQIGYNPFVSCTNIRFISNTDSYKVINGVLYTSDIKKLVCYPANLAIGDVLIPDSVIELERGAFSGCYGLKSISLHNVSIIGKSCFTNCSSLEEIYLSDIVNYVGEWAFAHCENLKKFSCFKDCYLDERVFSNTNCEVELREKRSNYVIESENLYTLNSLVKAYNSKIDSICIDPPYNSNISYIGYKDGNYEDGYLNFIYQRIILAYSLLSEKGFLVINIDEGELNNLHNLCNKIFGSNLVSIHKWKKKHQFFDTNRVILNPNKKQTDYEYIIVCRKSEKSVFNKIYQPEVINGKIEERISDFPDTFDCFGTTSSAKDEIQELFGRRDYFSTPKPVKLIKELVRATTDKDSIILDFFAGSGTTGQAVEELNNEDNGHRTYILISNSESNICQKVTVERMRKIKSNFIFIK